ncbi:MAG TPA: dephospho-CoA kinase, partial [Terriglobia bacterium]|nr:dephospho-CoA kinase [Terriglobia bacterium]
DRIGHELFVKSSPVFAEVVGRFGDGVLDARGEISRSRLGAIVFADPEKLRQLNAIVHPQIISQVEERAAELAARNKHSVILVDAALIFEAGIGGRFEKVIVTWCPPEMQLARLMDKGMTREEAERRVAAQMPVDEKKRRADFVIDSSGPLEKTRAQVEGIFASLQHWVNVSH